MALIIEVGRDGRAISSRSVGDGPASGVGACIAPVLRSLRFPAREDGEVSSYGVFYRLRAKGAGVGSNASRSVHDDHHPFVSVEEGLTKARRTRPARSEHPGPFTSESVRQVVVQALGDLRTCYSRALREHSGLEGRLTVSIVIGFSGRVLSTRVSESTLPPEVGSCIVGQVCSLDFPAPEGGRVPFTYSFYFRP